MKTLGRVILVIVVIAVAVLGYKAIRRAIEMQIYPLEHKQTIVKYANEYELDPYLIASTIWVESKYQPDAVSERGAVGLMQIMPETGEWIAGKLGKEDFKTDDLFDVDTNIEMGCWYLNYLQNRFASDVTKMMAAYNGGPNRVAGWLEDDAYANDGKLVNIPIAETKEYVTRVKDTYEIYKKYYTFE